MHERVDWGLAVLTAAFAGGTIADHLPPWSQHSGAAEDPADAMVAALTRMSNKEPRG